MVLCKKVHKTRKKVWPLLSLLHKQRRTENKTKDYNKAMHAIQKMLTDSKTHRDYQAFFMEMEKVILSEVMDKIKSILHIRDAKLTAKNEVMLFPKIRASDLMKAYRNIMMDDQNGDVHVLCTDNSYYNWDYSSIRQTLSTIWDRTTSPTHELSMAGPIAEAIIKIVSHPGMNKQM